jgi:hypothetical protein
MERKYHALEVQFNKLQHRAAPREVQHREYDEKYSKLQAKYNKLIKRIASGAQPTKQQIEAAVPVSMPTPVPGGQVGTEKNMQLNRLYGKILALETRNSKIADELKKAGTAQLPATGLPQSAAQVSALKTRVASLESDLKTAKETAATAEAAKNAALKQVASAPAQAAAPISAAPSSKGWKVRIAVTSVYFGPISSDYLYFTLESMKWNRANVDFYCYNVMDDMRKVKDMQDLAKSMGVTNLFIKPMTFAQWGGLIKSKLHIDLKWDQSWYYKINDYKPTFGYIFRDALKDYDYWAWMDW